MPKTKMEVFSPEESGIFITQPFPAASDGEPLSVMVGRSITANFLVHNGGDAQVVLKATRIAASGTLRGFHGIVFTMPDAASASSISSTSRCLDVVCPQRLDPGAYISFTITFTPDQVGFYPARILCDFSPAWRVVRIIQAIGDDDVSRQLRPAAPYQKPERKPLPFRRQTRVVPGIAPPKPKFEVALPHFSIPWEIRRELQSRRLPPVLCDGLTRASYGEYFELLLFAEELQMELDIQAYDMKDVWMRKNQEGLLALKVLGLAERRPSVIYRDRIYVKVAGTRDREYEGYVHRVTAEEVFLMFASDFQGSYIAGSRCNVQFSFSRINLRRCHQALANLSPEVLETFLFPSPLFANAMAAPQRYFHPISSRELNEEQTSAVAEIVAMGGAPPYIIFGPPGTGKTVTVIEAILQVCRQIHGAVVLACAPSNNAADLLLVRLAKFVEKRKLLRLNAFTRSLSDIPQEVRDRSNSFDGKPFADCPSREVLMSYQIIVTTCFSASLLYNRAVPAGHFSHIFVDEAGQATEPETMVSIISLATPSTVVVLAGDHKQLGPVVRSPVADRLGLTRSFMERLISSPPYTRPYNQVMVTKLVKNYRSHPCILELPSRIFYHSALVQRAGSFAYSLCDWEWLPNKNFPVLFIGVEGKDMREQGSPSWFNPQEVSKVIEVVRSLRDMRRNKPLASEIGVITPYRKQVLKIKGSLSRAMLQDVKVGSVEEFQGQERRAIVISTVRSTPCFMEHDRRFDLGFLFNPKRFNVAITRPQALLVVIGNPGILCKNEHWNEFLRYCIENGSYTGCPPPMPQAEDPVDDVDGVYVESESDEYGDQPWREPV